MRITGQLLKEVASAAVEETEYLDLSGKEILLIERLHLCQRLRTLILSDNGIEAVQNISCCRQLWNLDLSGNKIKSLCGLSRFPVLGSIRLGGNDLNWKELHRISRIAILNLSLQGNPKLDSDPHYRHHVIDMLPNIWMLDGRIITETLLEIQSILVIANERRQTEKFFNESESSSRPVRRKSSENVFVPTSLKNLLVNGVYGDKTVDMMSKFPLSYIHNIDMDRKRLSYLICTIQDDMKLVQSLEETAAPLQVPNLQAIFEHRERETEQCNMLLLLLLASLEYSLPYEVMCATLETAMLISIGGVRCADLFLLPHHMVLEIASLLLSAAAIDRLEKKEGGLYDQLYKSLCFTMETVQKRISCGSRKVVSVNKKAKLSGDLNQSSWRCLLASEVVHLMCLVPIYFESMQTSEELMKMTAIATKESNVSALIDNIIWKVQAKGGDVWEVYHDIASYLLKTTGENVPGRMKARSTMEQNRHKTTSQLLHPTQQKVSPRLLRAMSAGSFKRARTRRLPKSANLSRGLKEPELGDLVVTGAEQVARIVALPEPRVAVLSIHSTSLSSSNPDAYFYADTNSLVWDRQTNCWTKDGLASDLSSSQLSESLSLSTLPNFASITSLNSFTPRATTPEHGGFHATRPQSGMSFRSDDLQTIPSQEELIEGDYLEKMSPNSSPRQDTPIRVDIGSSLHIAPSSSSTSVTSENDHHKHVLQQYSLNRLRDYSSSERHKPVLSTNSGRHLSPRSQALEDLQSALDDKESKKTSESNSFIIPTPQLQFSSMWDSNKSVPTLSAAQHIKPHSCATKELNKQNLLIEPHMPPPPIGSPFSSPSRSLSLFSTSIEETVMDSGLFHSPSHDRPVIYNAWTATKSTPTKHSLLSSTRLMQNRQPQTPPVTRSRSSAGAYNQLHGAKQSGTGTYAILRSKQSNHHVPNIQDRKEQVVGKYHYHHPAINKSVSVRKLGNISKMPTNFFVGGKQIH